LAAFTGFLAGVAAEGEGAGTEGEGAAAFDTPFFVATTGTAGAAAPLRRAEASATARL